MDILWIPLLFFAGSLPFSVWLGRWALRTDIRQYGDGNPGGTNVLRAGGWKLGLTAMLLDGFKAAIPLWIAIYAFGLSGWMLAAAAVAAPMGHAFSPFLKGKGGKAVAAVFGAWGGLTIGEIPIMLGLFLGLAYWLLDVDGWAVLLAMVGVLAHLLLQDAPPLFTAVWIGHLILLAYTHRLDLRRRPGLKARLTTDDRR
jgi:acyl phosphate:glycerol-3-phosphate acyltransferase